MVPLSSARKALSNGIPFYSPRPTFPNTPIRAISSLFPRNPFLKTKLPILPYFPSAPRKKILSLSFPPFSPPSSPLVLHSPLVLPFYRISVTVSTSISFLSFSRHFYPFSLQNLPRSSILPPFPSHTSLHLIQFRPSGLKLVVVVQPFSRLPQYPYSFLIPPSLSPTPFLKSTIPTPLHNISLILFLYPH